MATTAGLRDAVTAFETVQVPERGSIEVSRSIWAELSVTASFWKAVEKGLVSAETLSGGRARIFGSCYVGRASISKSIVLELVEKVPGTLASMLQFAAGPDFRVERLKSPTSDFGPLISILIAQFVQAVRRYASAGRQFEYRRESRVGSLIGGRLNISKTVRLHASGLRHLAAFEKNVVSFDVPVNRTVLLALREIERLSLLIWVPSAVVSGARSLALLFADSRSHELLFTSAVAAAKRAEEQVREAKDPLSSDMLSLAAILLSHESFEPGASEEGLTPRSWFLNLETLFERAVRQSLAASVAKDIFVSSGMSAPAPIFPPRMDAYRANPDLVLRRRNAECLCIGDAKYKNFNGVAGQGDVYQLLVHAAAYGAAHAFLVFPSDDYFVATIGDAVTGAHINVFGVAVANLKMHLRSVALQLGVANEAPAESI